MVISAYGIPHDYFFPRWLLLLGPISILDVSQEKRRALHDRVAAGLANSTRRLRQGEASGQL